MVRGAVAAVVAVALLTAACAGDEPAADGSRPGPSGSPSIRTLTPIPVPPEPPPSGTLVADLQMSSRDAALGRFQVWVDNDTTEPISPTRVTYDDRRFRGPLLGTRLRDVPAQARRGFPVYYPDRPACGSDATSGTLTVDYTVADEQRSVTVPVEDEAEVVERITSARCVELAAAEVAELSWADEVTADGDGGEGSVGTLTLVVETTGRAGPTLVVESISGNPVLSPGDGGVHEPDLTITGDQPSRRVPVPIRPTRCDGHAFGESGGFAAFALNVRVDGEPGQFVLRLSPRGAAAALDYAKRSCGLLTGIGSG